MSQSASAPRIPSLRFPEFSGEWEKDKLENLTSKIGSGSTPTGGEKVYTNFGALFIRSQNVNNNALDLADKTYIPEEIHEKMKGSKVLQGDVLLNITGASIGRSCVVVDDIGEANVNQHVCIVRPNKTVNSVFLQSYLSSYRGQKLIYAGQTGSGREGLNFQSIASFNLIFPSLPEQTKIAAFLSSVDSKIDQLSQKKALLEQYKKGVMQQIFSQQIRFKADDGGEYPEWEEKKLGEVAKIYQPKTISQTDLTDDGYDVYGANGVIGKYHSYNHEFSQIAVTCRGNTCGTVNFTKPMSWITGNAMVINLDDSSSSNKLFFYHQLSNSNLAYLITGSGQPQITGDIKNHIVQVPLVSEQTKIAHFLTAIDSKIEQVAQQLEAAKQFKKGLLQQMFV